MRGTNLAEGGEALAVPPLLRFCPCCVQVLGLLVSPLPGPCSPGTAGVLQAAGMPPGQELLVDSTGSGC